MILSFLQAKWTSFCCSVVLILLFCCALLHWNKVLDSSAFFSHPWVLACHHKRNDKKCYKKYLCGIKLQLFYILHGVGKRVCGFSWAFLFVFFSSDFWSHLLYFSWLKLLFILFKEKVMEKFHIEATMQRIDGIGISSWIYVFFFSVTLCSHLSFFFKFRMSNHSGIKVLLEENVPASASCLEVNLSFKPGDLYTK